MNERATERQAAALLGELLEGWRQRSPPTPSDFGLDVCFESPAGDRLVVEVKSVPARSLEDAEARAALALLQILRNARPHDIAVVALHVSKVTDRVAETVAAMLRTHAPQVGWVLFDDAGGVRASIEAVGIEVTRQAEHETPRMTRAPSLFSDLNCWMLKILTLKDAPPAWWGGPNEAPSSATHLARIAGVSVAKAHQLVRLLREDGHATKRLRGLELRDPARFLRTWLDHESLQGSDRIPAQWAVGASEGLRPFATSYGDGRWAIGGLDAAEMMGVRHVSRSGPPLVHVDDLSFAFRWLGLVAVDDVRDAHVILSTPRFPESVFRGRIASGPFWHVDVWQAALDEVRHRGREQSDYLLSRVQELNPHG